MPNNKRIRLYIKFLSLSICLLFVFSCKYINKPDDPAAAFDPEVSFKEANDLIKKGYFEEAREKLENIKSRDASQKYATLAKIRIADTYFEEELYEESAVEYSSFLNIHAFHKYAPYAQYRLAMTYFKSIKTVDVSFSVAKKALEEFQRLQRNYPRNPYMDATESRIKMCKRILAEYEMYVGKYYFKKGSYAAAAGRFRGVIDSYPDSKDESEAMYYLGLSYNNMGEPAMAKNTLNSLIKKFPSIELSNQAKKFLASYEESPQLIIKK